MIQDQSPLDLTSPESNFCQGEREELSLLTGEGIWESHCYLSFNNSPVLSLITVPLPKFQVLLIPKTFQGSEGRVKTNLLLKGFFLHAEVLCFLWLAKSIPSSNFFPASKICLVLLFSIFACYLPSLSAMV